MKLTDPHMLQEMVSPLLQNFSSSNPHSLSIGHCLAEVCGMMAWIGDAQPVMAQILFGIQTMVSQVETPALKLLASLADRAPVAFTNLFIPSLPGLVMSVPTNITSKALEALTEVVVCGAIATTKTSTELVRMIPNLDEILVDEGNLASKLGSTLIPLLTALATCPDDALVHVSLEHVSHAAVTCPSLLAGSAPVLQTLVQSCLNMANNSVRSTTTRLTALQAVASLVSVGDVKRRILPSHTELTQTLVTTALPICAHLVADGVDADIEEWAREPATLVDDILDGDDDEALWAETLVQTFLQHLGAPALETLLPLVQQLLQSQQQQQQQQKPLKSWKYSCAGLALLECCLASMPVRMAPHIPVVVEAALSLAQTATTNSNLRVQYQAVRLLGALCEVPGNHLRRTHGIPILQRLAASVSSPCTKVSSMALMALVSYCRGGDGNGNERNAEQEVVPYLSDVLDALIRGPLSWTGTDSGIVTCRVRAMGATACLAEVVGTAFAPFYSTVMPGIMASAQLPTADVAGAAIEAATIVGKAVGRDLFDSDAQQLLSWILPVLPTESTHVSLDQLLSACARIASVLGESFVPHVPAVLPHLLRRIQEPPDVSVAEGDEAGLGQEPGVDERDGKESMTVALPGRGLTKVTINTSKIQEKAQAVRAVYEHAAALGESFGPYSHTCLEAILPLVSFPYSSDVRGSAAQTLAAVFDSACSYGEQIGNLQVPRNYLHLLATAIGKQIAQEDTTDMETLYALADSLSEIYYTVYRYRNREMLAQEILGHFSLEHAQQSVECCMKAMIACLERRSSITQVLSSALTGDDEREEYMDQLREEEGLLTPLVDSVGYTLKFFKQDFVPVFEQHVVPILGPYLASTADVRASVSAVCLFDDCVEHCGPTAAAAYAPMLMKGVLVALQDTSSSDRDLLRAATYGIAQMARYAPRTVMAEHIQTLVHRLLQLSSMPDEDDIYLVENAVCALASLTVLGPFGDLKFVNRDSLMNTILSHLPIIQDADEAKVSALPDVGSYQRDILFPSSPVQTANMTDNSFRFL